MFKNIFTKKSKVSTMVQRYTGFTLAEVLITLGIIGVVAAMTIPTLMAKFEKQQYVTQLKENYSLISQSVKMLLAEEGVDKVSDTTLLHNDGSKDTAQLKTDIGKFLKTYFKVIKDCGNEYPSPCFADQYKDINGNIVLITTYYSSNYSVIISNGASLSMGNSSEYYPPEITIDTNGPKKPNVAGRDLFTFSVYYDSSIDEITPQCNSNSLYYKCDGTTKSQARASKFDNYTNKSIGNLDNYGAGCLGKILNDNWKMDY